MSKMRLILLSLLVMGVISAAGPTSASAACGEKPSTHWVWCNDAESMKELGTPPAAFFGLGGLHLWVGFIVGVVVIFHCKDVHITGLLGLLGAYSVVEVHLGCKQIAPAACKLTTAQEKEIKTNNLEGETVGTLPGGPPEMLVKGEGASEEVMTLETEKPTGCSIPAGKYQVTGLQLLDIPEPESLKVEHEFIELSEEPSRLKLGGNEASFEGSYKIQLKSGLRFDLLPGT